VQAGDADARRALRRPLLHRRPLDGGVLPADPSAAAAFEAGYRPCLRCRPEAAPGSAAWAGTSATVRRALRLIDDGALDRAGVAALAARLGIGDRHLRRLFLEHTGASPLAVAQARRVLFAKRLIDETGLSMTDVAAASGFASVRRFNDAIRRTYGCPPTSLRARRGARCATTTLRLRLAYRAPFDWDGMLAYFALRATPGVEVVRDGRYWRSFELAGARGVLEVECDEASAHVVAAFHLATGPAPLIQVCERLRRMFDLEADSGEIAAHLGSDARLRRAWLRRPGLRVPGAWDPLELAVRAVLGQQVSVKGATTLAGRLVEKFGSALDALPDGGPTHLFPEAEVLAQAALEAIGLPRARAEAIRALAGAVADGSVDLQLGADPARSIASLKALPGIGEWTAQYVAMRALREPDAFPASDLGLRRALAPKGGDKLPTAREVEAMADAWRPCRAYAAVALWSLDAS
jgi:AraC family transcriptional regulator of adaptative response / DNA-3-methyladenine glycosylase II